MDFGNTLAELRQDRGLRQRDIAELLDLSVSTVSNYETNAHFPDMQSLIKIADFFDVSIDFLLGRTSYQKSFLSLAQPLSSTITPFELLASISTFDKKNMESLVEYINLLHLRK